MAGLDAALIAIAVEGGVDEGIAGVLADTDGELALAVGERAVEFSLDVVDARVHDQALVDRLESVRVPVCESGDALSSDCEPGVVAVVPGVFGGEDGGHGRIDNAADLSELVGENLLLDPALLFVGDVLELAAAAYTEVGAAGFDPLRRWPQHFHNLRHDVRGMLFTDLNDDPLARDSVRSEHDLAVVTVSDGLALVSGALKLDGEALRRAVRRGWFAAARREASVFLSACFHGIACPESSRCALREWEGTAGGAVGYANIYEAQRRADSGGEQQSVTTSLFGVGDRRVLDRAAEQASSPFTGMYAATEDGFWALRQRLIEEKEPGDISVMIAPGDRIPRIQLIEELLRLEAMGVDLVSAEVEGHPLEIALGPQDSVSPSERGQTIRESMARKALRGVVLGRIPYGYKTGDHGQLDEHPDEATVVKVIFGLAAQGKGIRAIAAELNSRGLQTRRGGAWSIVTIRDMLRNRVYTGAYNRLGARVAGNHPALVAPALFKEIQGRLDERAKRAGYGAGRPFLLSGTATCGSCGSHMVGVTRRQSWTRNDGSSSSNVYRYYQCEAATNQGRCSYHTRRSRELDTAVLARLGLDGIASRIEAAVDSRIGNLAREAAKGRTPAPDIRSAVQLLFHEAGRLRDATRTHGSAATAIETLLQSADDDIALNSLLRDVVLLGVSRIIVGEKDARVTLKK